MQTGVSMIEILGPGCARCHEAHRVVRHVVEEAGLGCDIQRVESLERMVALGVMRTPAVVFDGKVVLSGRIPKAEEVRRLLGLA
jgi:small redox-active disulfide protein 2